MILYELIEDAPYLSILFFLLGVVLIIAETYSAGFGFFGIAGIVSFVACILVSAKTVTQAILLTIVFFIVGFLVFMTFLNTLSKGRVSKKLTLTESTSKELGYSGTDDMGHVLRKTGTTATACRPAGLADIEGIHLDVVSRGEFIEKGEHVEVVEVEGNRIVVRAIPHSS